MGQAHLSRTALRSVKKCEVSLIKEALVVMNHYLAFKRTNRFERNADYDKHRRAAEGYVELCDEREDNGEYSDNSEEYSAESEVGLPGR